MWEPFSKIRCIVIVHCRFSSELIFTNFLGGHDICKYKYIYVYVKHRWEPFS